MVFSSPRFEYPGGARFRCLKCGICCCDAPARERRILLTTLEAEAISERLGTSPTEFTNHIEPVSVFSLSMKKAEGRCIFLRENLCTIYGLRPLICRFYPFRLDSLGLGVYAFQGTKECPGLGRGPRLSQRHFEKLFQMFLLCTGA